jgi:hypothetical protein
MRKMNSNSIFLLSNVLILCNPRNFRTGHLAQALLFVTFVSFTSSFLVYDRDVYRHNDKSIWHTGILRSIQQRRKHRSSDPSTIRASLSMEKQNLQYESATPTNSMTMPPPATMTPNTSSNDAGSLASSLQIILAKIDKLTNQGSDIRGTFVDHQ